MAMNRWLTLAAFGAAAYTTYRRITRRELARPSAAPEHLQTWEGEGGAVPVGKGRIAAAKPPRSEDLRGSTGYGSVPHGEDTAGGTTHGAATPGGDAPPLSIGAP